jgi:hypothetical protein
MSGREGKLIADSSFSTFETIGKNLTLKKELDFLDFG